MAKPANFYVHIPFENTQTNFTLRIVQGEQIVDRVKKKKIHYDFY